MEKILYRLQKVQRKQFCYDNSGSREEFSGHRYTA